MAALDSATANGTNHKQPASGRQRPLAVIGRVIGAALLVGLTVVWVRVGRGAAEVRRLIDEYESAHGALDLSSGAVDHRTEAIQQLCQQLDATAGYFYPFGFLVLVAIVALWVVSAVVTITPARQWLLRPVIAIAVAIAVIQLSRYGGAIADMVIIVE